MKKGFTLIELLVVITIIVILATSTIAVLNKAKKTSLDEVQTGWSENAQ